jgi:hypothetical protein
VVLVPVDLVVVPEAAQDFRGRAPAGVAERAEGGTLIHWAALARVRVVDRRVTRAARDKADHLVVGKAAALAIPRHSATRYRADHMSAAASWKARRIVCICSFVPEAPTRLDSRT